MRDGDIYRWFSDAVSHGILRHFPPLLRLKSGATAKVEHHTELGSGLTLTAEYEDTKECKTLVANSLSQAWLWLTGLMCAYQFLVPFEHEGGMPGEEGVRIITHIDGTEERQRYYAVTFQELFMERFREASRDCNHTMLPTIFHNALVRIGDHMANFTMHTTTRLAS